MTPGTGSRAPSHSKVLTIRGTFDSMSPSLAKQKLTHHLTCRRSSTSETKLDVVGVQPANGASSASKAVTGYSLGDAAGWPAPTALGRARNG